jgi:hypothetical protein
MTGAVGAHVTAARFAIDLRGDLAINRRNNFPRSARAARHERWTFERAFFSAGHTHADEVNSFSFEIFAAALRVSEKRIAAVNDDIAFFEKGSELTNDGVNRAAGFDHDLRLSRFLKRAYEFLHRARRLNIFSLGASSREFVGNFGGTIENGDAESFRFHVQDKVLAHYGESDQANITLIRGHCVFLPVV